jgi:hypothetical protein
VTLNELKPSKGSSPTVEEMLGILNRKVWPFASYLIEKEPTLVGSVQDVAVLLEE